MPAAGKNVQAEFEAQRIGGSLLSFLSISGAQTEVLYAILGAQLFDIDKISDKSQNLPHMLPTPMQFERQVSELGVNNDDHVVLYDQSGIYFASARVWWTFRVRARAGFLMDIHLLTLHSVQVFGHDNVSILQGGLQQWKEQGFRIVSGSVAPAAPGRFVVKSFRRNLIKTMEDMRENVNSRQFQVVDARPERRFLALDPEPRPQLLGGHIPGSKSLEFGKVLNRPKADLLDEQALKQVWQQAQTDLSKPIIATCGSGVSASVLALSAFALGNEDVAVYDGSWSEWGLAENKNPIEK